MGFEPEKRASSSALLPLLLRTTVTLQPIIRPFVRLLHARSEAPELDISLTARTGASQTQHQQFPSLPINDWSIPSIRPQLPPTPISPFRPLRPLSEDEKLAFPCTGSAEDCWNSELCPKHRDDLNQHKPSTHSTTPPEPDQMPSMPPNPRRRSAPASDVEPRPVKVRRNLTDPDEADAEDCARSRDAKSSLTRGRVPHNLVERRYRDNLNNQIEALRMTLPSLREAQPGSADFEDTASPRMPSKAIIISTAATYIKDMETERTRLLAANKALQEQVASLQKLVRCDDPCSILGYLNAMQLNAAQLATPT